MQPDYSVEFEDLFWLDYDAIRSMDFATRLDAFERGEYIALGSEHRPPWPIGIPLDWSANPFRDSDWRFQLNGWRIIEPALIAYENTRDPLHIRRALPYVADWLRFNVREGQINRYKWYDASTGLRALKLAYLLLADDRDDLLSAKERATVEELADLHLANLTEPKHIVANNHAFIQLHGAMALCRVRRESAAIVEWVKTLFAGAIRQQFGTEGMHKEHSPGYHFFAYAKVCEFLRSRWYDGVEGLAELEDKILRNAAWLIDANGQVIEVGDTSPHLRAIGHKPLPTAADEGAAHGVRLWREAGFATVRTLPPTPLAKSSLLFFSGAYHSKTHRHADDLAFVWMEGGEWILSDTGRYTYGDGERRLYTRSSQAHNTITADDTSASIEPRYAYGSALELAERTPWGFDLFGKIWHRDNRFFHARRLLYRPGEWLIVIDRLRDRRERARRFTAWFHFAEGTKVGEDGITLISGRRVYLAQHATFPTCSRRVVVGQEHPRQGWRAKDFRRLIPRPALAFGGEAAEGLMVHAFGIDQAPAICRASQSFQVHIGRWSVGVRSAVSILVAADLPRG